MRSSSSEVSSPALYGVLVGDGLDVGGWRLWGDVPLVEIHIGLLADQVAVSATDTLDLRQRVHDLLLAIDLYMHALAPCLHPP